MGVYDERIIRVTKFEYADIINRVRPVHRTDRFSYKYPRMSNEKRAKIFAPFAALSGYDDALSEKEIIYDIKRVLTDCFSLYMYFLLRDSCLLSRHCFHTSLVSLT